MNAENNKIRSRYISSFLEKSASEEIEAYLNHQSGEAEVIIEHYFLILHRLFAGVKSSLTAKLRREMPDIYSFFIQDIITPDQDDIKTVNLRLLNLSQYGAVPEQLAEMLSVIRAILLMTPEGFITREDLKSYLID